MASNDPEYRFDIPGRLLGRRPKPRTGRFHAQSNTPSAWLHASHDQQGKSDTATSSGSSRRAAQVARLSNNLATRTGTWTRTMHHPCTILYWCSG